MTAPANQTYTLLSSAHTPASLPPCGRMEIAFAGRSNCGKSSLLNALMRRRNLAFTSKAPGRTGAVFFYGTPTTALVDLPGYGYAARDHSTRTRWQNLVTAYFNRRPCLRLVFVLMDAARGVMTTDDTFINMLEELNQPWQSILTKSDRLAANDLNLSYTAVETHTGSCRFKQGETLTTSARKKRGIHTVRAVVRQRASDEPTN